MAFTRYVAVIFPIFIAAGEYLHGSNRRIWLAVTVACLAILQFFFLVRHINFQWAA
jgi:di/tricarboxylate transporter